MEKIRTEECKWKEEHAGLFLALLDGELRRVETAKLEHAMLAIAEQTAEHLARSRHWRLDTIGMSARDLALDAVAELLVKDEKGSCAGLRTLLERMSPLPEGSTSFCPLVHGIIKKLVLQAYSLLLAQHDQAHAHMQRALRRHERNTPDLTRERTYDGYAYRLTATDDLPGQPYMPWEELKARVARHPNMRKRGGAPPNPAVRVLYVCLNLLASQDEYRRAVHESDVLQLAKEILASELVAEEVESYEHDASEITGCKIHDLIEAALATIRESVVARYVRKGKLMSTMAESMLDAIREYAHDAAHRKPEHPSTYFRKGRISSEEYRKKYRRRYEHILERFNEELRNALRKGNEE